MNFHVHLRQQLGILKILNDSFGADKGIVSVFNSDRLTVVSCSLCFTNVSDGERRFYGFIDVRIILIFRSETGLKMSKVSERNEEEGVVHEVCNVHASDLKQRLACERDLPCSRIDEPARRATKFNQHVIYQSGFAFFLSFFHWKTI